MYFEGDPSSEHDDLKALGQGRETCRKFQKPGKLFKEFTL